MKIKPEKKLSLNTIGIHDRLDKLMQRTHQLSYQAELTYIIYENIKRIYENFLFIMESLKEF